VSGKPSTQPYPHRALGWLAWLTGLAIIYGSLVPFEYRAVSLHQAIEIFSHVEWLNLGIDNRADWIANLVLYFPFGFFTCGALNRHSLAGAVIITALLGIVLAVVVEFTQIWAAPRTVSLNDIIAEIAGSGLGIVGWVLWGKTFFHALRTALVGGPGAAQAALGLYLTAYIFLVLQPFDFVVSRGELDARLANPNAMVWIPQHYFSIRGLFYSIIKTLMMVPLGAATKLVWHRGVGLAILAALILSGALEIAHLFEHSAQMDAISIMIAILGAVLGHQVANPLRNAELPWTRLLKLAAWLATPIYLVILPAVWGWRDAHASRSQIEDVMASLHWLPFYYQYFTPEQHALTSMLGVSASFAPVGVLLWAMRLNSGRSAGENRTLWLSAFAATALAACMQAGALVTAGLRPDPTNLLIAACAAILGQRTCEWAARIGQDFLRTETVPR
jgi:VanZ family protein